MLLPLVAAGGGLAVLASLITFVRRRYPLLPPVSGEHAVAVTHFRFETGQGAHVFYPASVGRKASWASTGGFASSHDRYMRPKAAFALMQYFLKVPGFLGPALLSGASSRYPSSCPVAPPRDSSSTYPCVLFSHGLGGSLDMYSAVAADLASHGAVVIAIEHGDGSASYAERSRLPAHLQAAEDGTIVSLEHFEDNGDAPPPAPAAAGTLHNITYAPLPPNAPYKRPTVAAFRAPFIAHRLDDVADVLSALPAMCGRASGRSGAAADDLTPFDVADPHRMVLGGHSFGAATVATAVACGAGVKLTDNTAPPALSPSAPSIQNLLSTYDERIAKSLKEGVAAATASDRAAAAALFSIPTGTPPTAEEVERFRRRAVALPKAAERVRGCTVWGTSAATVPEKVRVVGCLLLDLWPYPLPTSVLALEGVDSLTVPLRFISSSQFARSPEGALTFELMASVARASRSWIGGVSVAGGAVPDGVGMRALDDPRAATLKEVAVSFPPPAVAFEELQRTTHQAGSDAVYWLPWKVGVKAKLVVDGGNAVDAQRRIVYAMKALWGAVE